MTRADIFVTAAELARLIADGEPVNVLDVRWELAQPDGREAYTRGHVPGAVYVSLDDELSDHSVPGRGRHPLPSGAAVGSAARRWGLRDGVPTVVYDDWNRAGSARAWWVLTAAGVADVRILDGGLAAWTASGGSLETGSPTVEPGDISVHFEDLYDGALPTLTADEVAEFDGVLLDARAPERFRGETEPVDPVAGHIPGARNVPSTGILDAEGRLSGPVANRYPSDANDVAVYCGSGVTASLVVAALHAEGVGAKLFPGSWSQWAGESRPVETGE
ncbi:sulfurtransferase [Mycobacterium sp. 236(2023)]|uniref:sulfurtransferase n=1 Tax=Mycobacterium sp. 236(2023) TaxID=3038163 RepID=UPI00241540F7|nr:sulfurtransferase [Mycobacterium sp. 236(2023)]MDG4665323.1 sulfurtransferase [Mycobacterium sp. 236(2023)]